MISSEGSLSIEETSMLSLYFSCSSLLILNLSRSRLVTRDNDKLLRKMMRWKLSKMFKPQVSALFNNWISWWRCLVIYWHQRDLAYDLPSLVANCWDSEKDLVEHSKRSSWSWIQAQPSSKAWGEVRLETIKWLGCWQICKQPC